MFKLPSRNGSGPDDVTISGDGWTFKAAAVSPILLGVALGAS
jgi:hypothetical protein